ncbi:MAG: hypothetical protein M1830_005953 [Pleopsidium flavum]|nr:MAG: hypothetical protein M1830_005953 [Pleopsidium flavum]
MPRQRSSRSAQKTIMIEQSTRSGQDDVDSDGSNFKSNDPMEKDEVEEELEKLVFGDDDGFKEELKLRRHHSLEEPSEDDHEQQHEELDEDGNVDEGLENVDDADLFFLDSGPSAPGIQADGPVHTLDGEDPTRGDNVPAWEDSDDERIMVSLASNPRLRKLRLGEAEDVINGKEYCKRLRRQFERLYPVPEWANPSSSKRSSKREKRRRRSSGSLSSAAEGSSADEMDVDDEELAAQPLAKLLQNADDLTRKANGGTRRKLRPEVLNIQRTKDVGSTQPSAITSLSFHPTYPLLLSSGPASTLYLHHISPSTPSPSPLLMSLHLRSTPLSTTSFAPPTGLRIFISGRRRYLHIWDLHSGKIEKVSRIYGHQDEQKSMERFKLSPCGRWLGLVGSSRKGGGSINLLDARTLQWIAQARIESRGGVADFEWWSDGEGMCIAGKNGEISEWSVQERRILARWTDEGAVGTTVIALGGKSGKGRLGGDRWIAVGSSSGIVNIYDRRSWSGEDAIPSNPKPTRVLDQLTTATSNLEFSTDGQLLAMSSRWKRDALRLVHLPSCTVYRNWPTSSTPLGRITSVAFSPSSDMLAVANEQGKIRLWEIRS